MDQFEEMTSNVDREVQIQMREAEPDLYKEDRLSRVNTRQREFWTRRVAKEVMEDVLDRVIMYRPVQEAQKVLEEMLDEMMEQAWINTLFKEVLDTDPGAVTKLGKKVANRQAVVDIVEGMMDRAMDVVSREERKSLQEKKRLEWQRNWEALDLELAREMDILMELETDRSRVEGGTVSARITLKKT